MSDTGTTTLTQIANTTGEVVSALAPLITALAPGAAEAVSIGVKIVQGVIAGVPEAIALFDQIKSGTPPTPDQLKAFSDQYEADYQALHADIQERLAAASVT